MKWLALLGLLFVTPAAAQTDVGTKAAFYKPLGYCQLTGISSATLLTACTNGVPVLATAAEICIETTAARYRDDGTSPTASVGMPVAAATCFQYTGNLNAISFIQQSSGTVVDISFYQ